MRFLALLLLAPAVASAEPPAANPGRPSFSDNATCTVPGAIEVEFGGVADPDVIGDATTLKLGLHELADLRLTLGERITEPAGIDGAQALLKVTLEPVGDDGVGVALAPYVNFATPEGDDREGYGAVIIGTIVAGPLQLDANTIIDVVPEGESDLAFVVTPVATLGFPLAGDLGGFVEVLREIPAAGGTGVTMAGAGLGYAMRDNLVFDASVHATTAGDGPDWIAQLGFTIAFWGRR